MALQIKIVLLLTFSVLYGCAPLIHDTPPPVSSDTQPGSRITAGENSSLNRPAPPGNIYPPGINDGSHGHDIDLPPEMEPKKTGQEALDEALELCNVSQDFWQKGDFENALQALDQAYALMIKVEENGTAELLQQKDDIRFLVSKRILEIYASRNRVVNGDHNAIPLTINKDVQKEIDRFTTGRDKAFFAAAYRRSGKYRPFIVEKLKAAGLPVELSWLPLIESGYKTRALSSARALGLWQFIPSTGYKFGLERNVYIDERLDPEKSTEAAIKYLTALHQMFGDWSTVLAAYNSGENRVLRTIRTQQINYLDDFWDLYKQLPWETARYVPKFLATLHIVSQPARYGLDKIQPDPPVTYEKVTISKQAHLQKIAQAIGVSQEALTELNPELRHKVLPKGRYELKVPPGKKATLLAAIKTIPIASPPQNAFVYHRVRRGESLSTIARKYRTSVGNIARANNIYRQNFIKAGRLLKIPLTRTWASRSSSPVIRSGEATTHTVRRGESLWIIARRYGTTVNTIQSANNLTSTTLSVGQVLKIPGRSGGGHKAYQVKRGDNPSIIAKNHGMRLYHFLQLNNLTKYSKIYPGQTVYVE